LANPFTESPEASGLKLAYEVMDGNTSEQKTLRPFLERIETTYGKARRVWVMDRGNSHRGDAGAHARTRRKLPALSAF
jgi:hypothetical protein